jgi:O-antigen ligase
LYAGNFTIDIANQHFLFGTGPTGYYFYMKAYLKDWFQLSHNNYVDIYAQTGIFGFITYLLVWGSIGWTVWRTYRLVPKSGFEGGLAVSLVAVFLITMIIMMLGDWVTPFTYTQTMRGLSYTIWPWLWAGLAIALNHLTRQSQKLEPQKIS